MLLLFILGCLISTGLSSSIVTEGDSIVVLHQDATFSCSFRDTDEVKQVSWQRVIGRSVTTLATYSTQFKDKVDDSFAGKVVLEELSLNSTTIKLKTVTFADEACYVCTFNAYPRGSKRAQICLTVQGISEITSEMQPLSKEDVMVNCSATGKPKPDIRWNSEGDSHNFTEDSSSSEMDHNNGTVTVRSNLILHLPKFHGNHVECVVTSGEIMQVKRFAVRQDESESTTEDDDLSIADHRPYIALAFIPVILIICLVTAVILRRQTNGHFTHIDGCRHFSII